LPSTAQVSSPFWPLNWPNVQVSPFDHSFWSSFDAGPVHASIESDETDQPP
jgi:hypothetical protein